MQAANQSTMPRRPLIIELDEDESGGADLSSSASSEGLSHIASTSVWRDAAEGHCGATTAAGAQQDPLGGCHLMMVDAQPTASQASEEQDAAVREAIAALSAVPSPPHDVFADISGEYVVQDAAAAEQQSSEAEAALRGLAAALPRLSAAQLEWGVDPNAGAMSARSSAGGGGGRSTHSTPQPQYRRAMYIEEVTDKAPPPQQLSAAAVLRAAALYAPEPRLGGAWATAATGTAAASVLQQLMALASAPAGAVQSGGAPSPTPLLQLRNLAMRPCEI